ncbi:MAG: TraB/GumN family protein [Hyphomicrobium aestuarii]|nr:TraB/GumN family protein [Hyphomicrobium aestuarii]
MLTPHISRTLASAVAATVLSWSPALAQAPAGQAQPAKAAAVTAGQVPLSKMPPPVCSGQDMLAEIAKTDPAGYAAIMAKAAATENADARLWKIEKPGVATPSYLFGTIHMTDDRVLKLSPVVEAALAKAKVVAVEVTGLGDAERATRAMLEAADAMVFTDGRDLSKVLSADEFAAVAEVTAVSGMPPDAVRLLKPWVVSMQLATSVCEKIRVEAGVAVLDSKIEQVAQAKKIKVIGLETVKEQVAAMSKMPEADQVQHLRAGLKYRHRLDDSTATLIKLYLDRNVGAALPLQAYLADKANVGKVSFVSFEKALLTDRNLRMRDRAKPLVDKGGAFIAVGALHMPGKSGLVTLFRDAGYTVTRVE